MRKNTTKIIVACIAGMAAVGAAYFGGEQSGKDKAVTVLVNNVIQHGDVSESESLKAYSDSELMEWLVQQYNQSLNNITQLNTEKKELNDQLEEANQEINNLKRQETENNENAEIEKESMKAKLEEGENKISELQGTIEALKMQMNNEINVNFKDTPIYVEQLKVSSAGDTSLALINGIPYYSEEILKKILEENNKLYEYSDARIDIFSDIEASKVMASKAEVYEINDGVSLNSGIRQDINGNEFSGILISGNGRVAFLLNGKYKKMKGIVHVAKESNNDWSGYVRIYKIDSSGNTTQVHESKELTKLSGIDDFSNGCDIEDAVVVIIEGYSNRGAGIDAVISDAYFYND